MEMSKKMIPLRNTWAAVAAVAVLTIGGIASAAIPPSITPESQLATPSETIVVAANEEPTKGHHYDKSEFDRQSAVLAPKDGDNTRLFAFGGLGLVLVGLLGFVAINRKKWGNPSA